MKVFINLSNHRSNNWDENQINEAKKYGEIIDIDFPVVNPLADEKAISDLVNKYYDIIISKADNVSDITVHLMGEMTFTVQLVKKSLNKSLDIEGVVMTMYDYRTNLSNEVYEEAKKFFNDKVYKTTIARNIRLAEAPSFGLPIMLYDEKCKGADAYKRFAKEFLSKQ